MFGRVRRRDDKAGRAKTALAVALSLTLTGAMATTAMAKDPPVVSFGVAGWPGSRIKTMVAERILNGIGYKTHTVRAAWVIDAKSVATGDLDADTSLWRPTEDSVLVPLLKSHKVVQVGVQIPDANYDIVVPDYVWNAGVHAISDLAKPEFAKKFDHKIYGIEPGNDGNELVLKMIKDDTYGLKHYHVVQSSTSGMLAEVGIKVKQHKWIAFLGWTPHWMNTIYHIKYLDDPLKVWGGKSTVTAIMNTKFAKDNANIARFLSQMQVSAAQESKLIYDYSYKKQKAEPVADAWIKSHASEVKVWLAGVKSADGTKPAFEALKDSGMVD